MVTSEAYAHRLWSDTFYSVFGSSAVVTCKIKRSFAKSYAKILVVYFICNHV